MVLIDVLGGLLRPAVCLACGVPGAWPCCARCLPAEPDDVGPWPLAADPEVALWALGPYRDALRAAVLAGKLDGQPAALTELGRRLGIGLAHAGVGADLVTYVAAGRVAGPPRDHAERVAAGVAAALDLPLVGLLTPAGGPDLGRTRQASRTHRAGGAGPGDPADRTGRAGGTGRSAWPPPGRPPPTARYRLAGGRVLLVDDLATTGGTLAGAAATLRHAGARQVEAAVLAAAPTALGPGPVLPATRRSGAAPRQGGDPGRSLDNPVIRAGSPGGRVVRVRSLGGRTSPPGPAGSLSSSSTLVPPGPRRPRPHPGLRPVPEALAPSPVPRGRLAGVSRDGAMTGICPAHGGRIVWL
jgi:predicted amidophosphoribosyltransferase